MLGPIGGIVLFEISSEATGLATYIPDAETLKFQYKTPRLTVIELRKDYPDGRKPVETFNAVCTGATAVDPPDEKIAAELKAGWKLPVVNGKINLDDPTLKFIDEIFSGIRKLITSSVILFRWRYGVAEGHPNPLVNSKQRYSGDGKNWHDVSLVRSVTLRFGMAGPGTAKPEICQKVVELVEAGAEESLGRQRFREA